MSHHHHHHVPEAGVDGKNILFSIILNVLITICQIIGGLVSGSLALLSDALHNFSDVVSLIVSYVANILVKKKASTYKTFGYKRAEIIAAFINAASLIVVALYLIKEAVERFLHPQEIGSTIVIWMTLLGIIANGLSVVLLHKDAKANMNMRSAYLHLFTDMMASVAVLVGGILMYFYKIYWVDAVLTLLIALYLVYMGYDLLRTSTRVLMLFTPDDIDIKAIERQLQQIDQVKNVHHVHVWQLNENELHLEAHIDFENDIYLSQFDVILDKIEEQLFHDFGINHVTLQPEFGKCDAKSLIVQD